MPVSWLQNVSIDPGNNIKKTSTDDNLADVMTKALEKNKSQHFEASFGSSHAWLRFAWAFTAWLSMTLSKRLTVDSVVTHVSLDLPHDLMLDFLIFVGRRNVADFPGC